jgi:hypothetical protein
VSINPHTKDKQQTKPTSDSYRNNFDAIFRKKPEEEGCKRQNELRDCQECGDKCKPLDK